MAALIAALAASGSSVDESDDDVNQLAATAVIESVDPALITPTTESFTISGTVTNTGADPLINVNIQPRWSKVPVADRAEIRRVLTDPDFDWGPGGDVSDIRYGDPFPWESKGDIAPGETIEFDLTFESEHLNDPEGRWFSAAGVYIVGVDVKAGADADHRPTFDSPHTVVTWLPGDEELPEVPVAMAWPATARPSIMAEGEFLDDSLAGDLAAGGRLSTLVKAARSGEAPLSWLVDPDVLTTIDTMTDGYQVRTSDGLINGQGVGDAAAWRSDFDNAAVAGEVHLLPANQPDLGPVRETNPQLAAKLASQATETARSMAASQPGWQAGTAWFDQETFDPAALSLLNDNGVDSAVVRSTAVSGDGPVASVETRSGIVSALVTDASLDSSYHSELTRFDLEQRWRAETALMALHALETGDPVDPIITAPPQDWSPSSTQARKVLAAWTSADWIRPVTLTEVRSLGTPDEAQAAEHTVDSVLSSNTVASLTRLDSDQRTSAALVTEEPGDTTEDPDSTSTVAPDTQAADQGVESSEDGARTVLRASSSSWRGDSEANSKYISLVSDDLRETLSGVRVIARNSVTLTSGSGEFPLTIENSLDMPVTVSLNVVSSNNDRLTIGDIPEQVVDPGGKVTVPVSAEAKANGRVPVTVQLVNANGDHIGPIESVYVNAAEYGSIAWIIVGAAGLLFGAGLVRRATRGRTRSENDDNLESSSDEPVEKVAQ